MTYSCWNHHHHHPHALRDLLRTWHLRLWHSWKRLIDWSMFFFFLFALDFRSHKQCIMLVVAAWKPGNRTDAYFVGQSAEHAALPERQQSPAQCFKPSAADFATRSRSLVVIYLSRRSFPSLVISRKQGLFSCDNYRVFSRNGDRKQKQTKKNVPAYCVRIFWIIGKTFLLN